MDFFLKFLGASILVGVLSCGGCVIVGTGCVGAAAVGAAAEASNLPVVEGVE